jgi:hypothetical protein
LGYSKNRRGVNGYETDKRIASWRLKSQQPLQSLPAQGGFVRVGAVSTAKELRRINGLLSGNLNRSNLCKACLRRLPLAPEGGLRTDRCSFNFQKVEMDQWIAFRRLKSLQRL